MLDLRRLSYFVAVATERSFTRAGERLLVAQPALSRQVRLLEDELGTPLLVRGGPDGLETTAAGALLLARAPALIADLEALREDVERLGGDDRESRTVRLGYAASAGYETAVRVVAAMRERDGAIDVRARVVCVADALEALGAGTLDAALLREPPASSAFERRLVRRELQGVLLRDDHPLAAQEVVSLSALRDVPIVVHPRDANPGRWDAIVDACRAAGFEPRLEPPLVAFDPAHQAIRDGAGATIVSRPAGGTGDGLTWRPVAPALVLDVVLLTPRVAAAPGVATLAAVAGEVAEAEGWLRDPRRLAPLPPEAGRDAPGAGRLTA
ncbi:LysR family transcriptional regulator [Patulibacter sp.]|uniref:LysR substrate-binding domain-containing protein n=1 Tax=Patulibacter sp. TaxID=1912859 RepID=UPI002715692E|nr:LysR family transcriptional regulator [Patulibacter sp.]MDO9409176.1 LysR family transcriptional regulator [Patulibacter sp.]